MENQNDVEDISKTQEEADLDTANENESDNGSESVEEVKARLAKAEELANNYKIRAEKAEKLAKSSKESPEVKKQASTAGAMSNQDLYALVEAKVPQEDLEVVEKYAKLEGISIVEALKSTIVKTILSEKAEMRNVASASNIGSVKRGTSKLSDDALVQSVKKGNIPETDEDMMRYVQARQRK